MMLDKIKYYKCKYLGNNIFGSKFFYLYNWQYPQINTWYLIQVCNNQLLNYVELNLIEE